MLKGRSFTTPSFALLGGNSWRSSSYRLPCGAGYLRPALIAVAAIVRVAIDYVVELEPIAYALVQCHRTIVYSSHTEGAVNYWSVFGIDVKYRMLLHLNVFLWYVDTIHELCKIKNTTLSPTRSQTIHHHRGTGNRGHKVSRLGVHKFIIVYNETGSIERSPGYRRISKVM